MENDTAATSTTKCYGNVHSRLILGNGASELIDLVTRTAAPVGGFVLKSSIQYKEYERAALADGRGRVVMSDHQAIHSDMSADAEPWTILAIINPCNPTGEYMDVSRLKEYIEKTVRQRPNISQLESIDSPAKKLPQSCVVLVDESMQLWRGPDWRSDSLVSQEEWIYERMLKELGCAVFVIHSWTKIWSCPGIRLGSILCPSIEHALALKKHQVPWSLNIAALAFLSSAVMDREYLRQTWELTLSWRRETVDKIGCLFPHWKVYGERWLSWLWVDTGSDREAADAVRLAKSAGTPIRNGAMGYEEPTFIRIAVRSPDAQAVLFKALKPLQH